jgi:hypothetical protein
MGYHPAKMFNEELLKIMKGKGDKEAYPQIDPWVIRDIE